MPAGPLRVQIPWRAFPLVEFASERCNKNR
jgi:hypothetical protein